MVKNACRRLTERKHKCLVRGQEVTWEMAMNSKEALDPSGYAWDAKPPAAGIAIPGQTRFV